VTLAEKAKTIIQLRRDHDEWIKTFREGAQGHQGSYNLARDTRKYFEEEKWVRLEDAEEEIQHYQICLEILQYYEERLREALKK